jgi:hypothetical protein
MNKIIELFEYAAPILAFLFLYASWKNVSITVELMVSTCCSFLAKLI